MEDEKKEEKVVQGMRFRYNSPKKRLFKHKCSKDTQEGNNTVKPSSNEEDGESDITLPKHPEKNKKVYKKLSDNNVEESKKNFKKNLKNI